MTLPLYKCNICKYSRITILPAKDKKTIFQCNIDGNLKNGNCNLNGYFTVASTLKKFYEGSQEPKKQRK